MKKEEFDRLVQEAREADLLDFFQKSGYTVKKSGSNYYINEFPGLCIKPETGQWYHHYTNVGRTRNAVDCLTSVLGYNFNQAVYELTGQDISTMRASDYPKKQAPQYTSPPKPTAAPKEKKSLQMPEQAENMRRMFAYFCQHKFSHINFLSKQFRDSLVHRLIEFHKFLRQFLARLGLLILVKVACERNLSTGFHDRLLGA